MWLRALTLPWLVLCLLPLPSVLHSQAPPHDSAPAKKKGTASVEGQVVIAVEGTAAPRLRVLLLQAEPSTGGFPARYGATTDDHGRFVIRELPAGRYSLMAPVFSEQPQFVADDSARPAIVELSEGQRKTDIVLTVRRAGVIVVRAVTEFGDPIVDAQAMALRVEPGRGEPHARAMRQTDDQGRARLFGLEPGDYYVKVEHTRRGGFSEGAEREPTGYLPTFHPGALTLEEATPLHVEPGQEIGDIEVQVRRGRTFRVSGIVLNARGAAAAGATVFSHSGGSGTGETVRPDGSFEFSGLTPGEYTFHATTLHPMAQEAFEPEASIPMTLQVDSDIKGLALTMRRGARVAGRVTARGASTAELPSLLVRAQEVGSGRRFSPPPTSPMKPDGSFVLTPLFGPVMVRADVMPPWFTHAVRYKGADITDEAVEFSDSTDPRHLEVIISKSGAARLTARVADARGLPAEGGIVLLFAADEKKRLAGSTMTGMGWLKKPGVAELEALRPGSYLAVAFDPAGAPAFRGGDLMLDKLAPLATPVELLENDAREISLILVSFPQ